MDQYADGLRGAFIVDDPDDAGKFDVDVVSRMSRVVGLKLDP